MQLLEDGCSSESEDAGGHLEIMDGVLGEMGHNEIGGAGLRSVGGPEYGMSQVLFVLLRDDGCSI